MGDGNKAEMLIAICALISSAVAVFIAWDQGRVMRAQQHGEVFPIIQIDGFATNSATRSALGIRVSNSGVGPAIIESVELEIGNTVVNSLDVVLADLPDGYELSWVGLTGRALAPGEQQIPVEIGWPKAANVAEEITEFALTTATWRLRICYCSVFGRCWRTNSLGTARAESVSVCERGETDIFNDLGTSSPLIRNQLDNIQQNTSADGAPT
ncbi:MAG: hypothetical protein AAGC81_20365 [Pseudomonadota bacterium]